MGEKVGANLQSPKFELSVGWLLFSKALLAEALPRAALGEASIFGSCVACFLHLHALLKSFLACLLLTAARSEWKHHCCYTRLEDAPNRFPKVQVCGWLILGLSPWGPWGFVSLSTPTGYLPHHRPPSCHTGGTQVPPSGTLGLGRTHV